MTAAFAPTSPKVKAVPRPEESLRAWYVQQFPSDDLGLEINPAATFYGLFKALDYHLDVYDYISVGDSVIRERLFQGLAACMDVDYGYIYDQWLGC